MQKFSSLVFDEGRNGWLFGKIDLMIEASCFDFPFERK